MGTIENVKEMAMLIKNLGDLDLYRRILDLQGEIIELTGAKRSLEEQNLELKKQLEFGKKMQFQEPFWYAEGDGVPFCPSCWESKKLAIHLEYAGRMSGGHRHDCPHCEHCYCSEVTPGRHQR
jgi:hypothetical protein